MIGELVEEGEKDDENRKLNKCPLTTQMTTPIAEMEHNDLNLCRKEPL